MKVNRGGNEAEYKLHQWANDWISADGPNGPEILSPLQVILDEDEMKRVKETVDDVNVGIFWLMWELDEETGRFKKKPRQNRRKILDQIINPPGSGTA